MLVDILKYIYRKPQHIVVQTLAHLMANTFDLNSFNNVIIFSPHPDDEVFGCGELIKSLCGMKKNVTLVILSKGEAIAEESAVDASVITRERKRLTVRASEILGLPTLNIVYLSFTDGKFGETDIFEEQKIDCLINELKPDTLFYPHPWDGSPDHEVASSVIKNIANRYNVSQYYYCVWLWHHMKFIRSFKLNYHNSFLLPVVGTEKKKAIDIYVNAMHDSGLYYSGKLPSMFVKAISWKYELYFKA